MISVIVTTYNIEEYVEQCLRSVIGQTYRDLEIIVVDDGSSDGTREIINKVSSQDARIVPVLLPENTPGGVAVAANIGMATATGEYIGFVDGDDWCEPFMFEKLVTSAEKHGVDLVVGNFKNYDELTSSYYDASDKRHWLSGLPEDEFISGEAAKKSLLKFNPVPWRKLYNRAFIEKNAIRFPEGDYFYEDNPFHWFCVAKADGFSLVPEYLCYHRMNRVGQTMSSGDRRLLAMYEHHQTIHDWLKDGSLLELYKVELILWVVNNTCWIYDAIRDEFKGEVLASLSHALDNYDREFLGSTLVPGNMGDKGRKLADRALGDGSLSQGEGSKAKIVNNRHLGLVGDAVVYYKRYGVVETAKKIRSYLYARAPYKVRKVAGLLRRSHDTNNADENVVKSLKEIREHLEFQKLMHALSEEENEKMKDEVKKLREDVKKIKDSL
ncbi:glycosyltransferase family 2 protein [Halomonas borealis]|uniref:glycosyltransferase family 2 protein n=1 Tax=Halomonas borealis TaxID=2508710 RepID=UPI0010A05BE9|nr:glycosyltransferase family 2 protein [Halomonas borealis]